MGAPEKGISSRSAPLLMGGRSPIASRTVTARRGRPGAASTAVYATWTVYSSFASKQQSSM